MYTAGVVGGGGEGVGGYKRYLLNERRRSILLTK